MKPTTTILVTAICIVIIITISVYWIQLVQARKYSVSSSSPIYIAKPDWYVNNMEWQPNTVLYDGGNLYYSDQSHPK